MSGRPAPDAGFTLVEVLVALALFAAIGLAGFTVLDVVLAARERTEGRMERLAEIERALTLASRDLAQRAPGPLTAGAEGVAFRSRGAAGPAAIRWSLEDGTLWRRIAPGGGAVGEIEQRVLEDVTALRWRFLDAERAWHEAWPPEGEPTGGAPTQLRAVEVEIAPGGPATSPGATASRLVEMPRTPEG